MGVSEGKVSRMHVYIKRILLVAIVGVGVQGILPLPAFSQTAKIECGADRRCRIARLKRIQKERRRINYRKESRATEQGKRFAERAYLAANPRLAKRMTADIRMSRVGFLGLALGYTFSEQIRGQLAWQYVDINDWNGVDIEANQLGISGEYLITTGKFASFVSGGLSLMEGSLGTQYNYNDYNDEMQNNGMTFLSYENTLNGALHFLELGAGLDLQFGNGLHGRIMGAYKYLLYHQATINGSHDEKTREELKNTFEDYMKIDIIFQLGYAF